MNLESFTEWQKTRQERSCNVSNLTWRGEFDNQIFARYCEDYGITMEKVPKASSAVNGYVEHMNCTIIEDVHTMLLDAKIDCRWWAEAAVAQCYMRWFISSA
jgi:hypothetical protein